jgi:hypothetical protein
MPVIVVVPSVPMIMTLVVHYIPWIHLRANIQCFMVWLSYGYCCLLMLLVTDACSCCYCSAAANSSSNNFMSDSAAE